MKPHINAIDVEPVIAFGEETTHLAVFELGQADGAFERLLLVGSGGLGGEDEDGEGSEDGGI